MGHRKTPEAAISYDVEDENHKHLEHKYVATRRDDVSQIYFGSVIDREFGFDIQFPYERGKDYYLVIRGEGRRIRVKYNEDLIAKRSSVAHKKMQKIRDLMNMETVRVAYDFWKENGLKALLKSQSTRSRALTTTTTTASGTISQSPQRRSWRPRERQCLSICPSFLW